MPRARTGTVRRHNDHWDARITLPDGTRPWVHLPVGETETRARERAASMSEKARLAAAVEHVDPKAAVVPEPAGETFEAWAERWCQDREKRGLTSVDDDRGRLRKWISPTLGPKPVATMGQADLEALVEILDEKVLDGELSWKTATNAWGLVSKAFADACRSKVRALRVRNDNPAQGVRGPDRGAVKSKAYLYPAELLKLVSCPAVPAPWRRMYVVVTYLYLRAAEARALDWADVNLDGRVVLVHQTEDAEGETGSTKSMRTRRVLIEAAVMPLLVAMHRAAGGKGPVLPHMPVEKHLAPMLRRHLQVAGITRADLFAVATDKTRKRLRFHDLRSTGITWMAIRGDDPLKLKQRAGHRTFSTTEGYIREAEAVREGFGEVFPALPASLESSAESSERFGMNGHAYGTIDESAVGEAGFEPPEKRVNPHVSVRIARIAEPATVRLATRNYADPGAPDATRTLHADPRAVLMAALGAAIPAALAVGDVELVRVATEALARLLGSAGSTGAGAAVVDLAAVRARRGQ